MISFQQSMDNGHKKAGEGGETAAPVVVIGFLILTELSGAGLLAWWSAVFHPSNEQLWMVPLGLVMAGTPIMVWFLVFAAEACRRFELRIAEQQKKKVVPADSDAEKQREAL